MRLRRGGAEVVTAASVCSETDLKFIYILLNLILKLSSFYWFCNDSDADNL